MQKPRLKLTLICAAINLFVCTRAVFSLSLSAQSWARGWFVLNCIGSLICATIHGSNISNTFLNHLQSISNLMCESVGLPLLNANLMLFQNAKYNLYKNFLPEVWVWTHLGLALVMSVMILGSAISRIAMRKLETFSAAVSILEMVWMLVSFSLTGELEGLFGTLLQILSSCFITSSERVSGTILSWQHLHIIGLSISNYYLSKSFFLPQP